MKRIYLIRHAKSSWKDTSLQDFDRPLNARGRRDAPEMGRRLRQSEVVPDFILSSSAIRASNTAKAIADSVGYPLRKIGFREELYHASAPAILEVIRGLDDRVNVLFLFGHNPGLTDFANRMASQGIDNIVTCGIYALEINKRTWQQVELDRKAELLFYDFPKNKKARRY